MGQEEEAAKRSRAAPIITCITNRPGRPSTVANQHRAAGRSLLPGPPHGPPADGLLVFRCGYYLRAVHVGALSGPLTGNLPD